MANVNNEILYDEKIFFTHEIDISLSNETVLIEGDDVPYIVPPPDDDTTIENIDKVSEERPQRTRRKRKLAETASETASTTDAPMQTRSKRACLQTTKASQQTVPETTETIDLPMRTRSKRVVARTTTRSNSEQTTSSVRQTSTRVATTQNKRCRAHVPSDDDSDSNVSSDSHVYEIMERISRDGPVMLNLRKRFKELEKQEAISIDPDSFKCIICCERKKNTILFPGLHQHTCGPCWIMWKIQQINSISLESIMDDEATKPKCPVCRQGVDEFKEAKN